MVPIRLISMLGCGKKSLALLFVPCPLAVPAVRDRVAQAAALNIIGPLLENEFEDVSYAYRKGRSVKQAAMRIKELRDQGYRFVVEVDLVAYFDHAC